MLRIFMAPTISGSTSGDPWDRAFDIDHKFPLFLEGSKVTNPGTSYIYYPLKRTPLYSPLESVAQYLEYFDLATAAIDFTVNTSIIPFADQAGAEAFTQFPTSNYVAGYMSGTIVNRLTLEADTNEFYYNTKRTDYVVPDATRFSTPHIIVENPYFQTNPTGTITGYRSISVSVSGTELATSYCSAEGIIPYHTINENLYLHIFVQESITNGTFNIYIAPVTLIEATNKSVRRWRLDDVHRLTEFNGAATTGWNNYTYAFLDDAYESRNDEDWVEFEPCTPVWQKIALDFYNRNRGARVTNNWLVLNTDTHQYYKCILLSASAMFIGSPSIHDESTSQLELGVFESGTFIDDALDDPTGTGNLIPEVRTYV